MNPNDGMPPWADDDLPDGTCDPDLRELLGDLCHRWRGPAALILVVLMSSAFALLVVSGMVQGYQASHGAPPPSCVQQRDEGLAHRLRREIACWMMHQQNRARP